MKILVVDDDCHVTDLLSIALKNEGFGDVTCFNLPEAAFQALIQLDVVYDCLILDIDMPKLDGIRLCKMVKQIPEYNNVPVVMLTAIRDEQTVRTALAAGASDYITKPFDVLQIGLRVQVAAKLVNAHNALRSYQSLEDSNPVERKQIRERVTQREIMRIFSEDLYGLRSG